MDGRVLSAKRSIIYICGADNWLTNENATKRHLEARRVISAMASRSIYSALNFSQTLAGVVSQEFHSAPLQGTKALIWRYDHNQHIACLHSARPPSTPSRELLDPFRLHIRHPFPPISCPPRRRPASRWWPFFLGLFWATGNHARVAQNSGPSC